MGIFPKRTLATEEAVVFLHEKALVQYKQHKISHFCSALLKWSSVQGAARLGEGVWSWSQEIEVLNSAVMYL